MTSPHIIIGPDGATCNNELPIVTALGGLALPSKFCILPRGHAGHHTDGLAIWRNVVWHNEQLERRK